MRVRAILAALTLGAMLTSCAYPIATIEQDVARTSLYFPNARADARVFVDGADAGMASAYDGRKAMLRVEPGKHHILVTAGGANLYNQQIYVGADSRLAIEAH